MEKFEAVCVAANHHAVHTEIRIAAAPADVWRVLTDFGAMPDWSPSFKGISGEMADGGSVVTRFDMGDGVEEYAAILRLEDGVWFGWAEDYDGIHDDHRYRVEATGEARTRFVQTDAFVGEAEWATTANLAELYVAQYAAFNRALKAECERRFALV